MPSRPPDIRADRLPRLEHFGSGSHYHVFGRDDWAVKVPRLSSLSLVSSAVRSRRWLHRVQLELGDLVLPFAEIEHVAFRAPAVLARTSDATAVPNTERVYRARRALVTPAVAPGDFLDQKFYPASAPDAVALLRQMLDHLEALRARGFVMLDFIMKNFVFHAGRLQIADTDLVVPAHLVRWHPSYLITLHQFRHFMLRDYHDLLVQKGAADGFFPEFAARVRDLSKPASPPRPEPVTSRFPGGIALNALRTLTP